MTTLIKIIFHHEWLLLKRNGLMLALLLGTVACAAYSVYYGTQKIGQQLAAISFMENLNQKQQQTFFDYFKDPKVADSTRFGWHGKYGLHDGISAEELLKHNVAINPPNALSHLAIGQRDVYPLYYKVSSNSLYYDGGGMALDESFNEIVNPHKLLAGNFDLSFVLLYLFPLLVIGLNYNLLSQEHELGTYPLLAMQGVGIPKLVAVRLLYRYILVALLVVAISVAGFLLSPLDVHDTGVLLTYWLVLSLSYLLVWFGLCWLIIALNKGSSFNALALAACWLLFLIIIPALINNLVAATHKIDSRSAFISNLSKQINTLWREHETEQIAAYNQDYPELAIDTTKPLWSPSEDWNQLGKDMDLTLRYHKKKMLMNYYIDKVLHGQVTAYYQQKADKVAAEAAFNIVNPVLAAQDAFNLLAASGTDHYESFKQQVGEYRNRLFAMTNQNVFREKRMTLADYQAYPAFALQAFVATGKLIQPILTLWLWGLLLIAMGMGLFKRQCQSHQRSKHILNIKPST
jgi:ABC-2 type transport system permease protein